jgi:hypothetical protein
MMGRRHLARLRAFAGWACLAAALAIAPLTLRVVAPAATPDEDDTPTTSSFEFNEQDGTLSIAWSGAIAPGMADYLRTALDKYGAASHRVVLFLNSAGGQVDEGARVIHLLDGIKPTHPLITAVLDGSLCASMCIPVFLQGDDRLASRTSQWIFHEAAKQGATEKERREETLRLFQKYYLAAGVSVHWLKRIEPIIGGANLWQSGGDLISANTGIVTYPLEKWTQRLVPPQHLKST